MQEKLDHDETRRLEGHSCCLTEEAEHLEVEFAISGCFVSAGRSL